MTELNSLLYSSPVPAGAAAGPVVSPESGSFDIKLQQLVAQLPPEPDADEALPDVTEKVLSAYEGVLAGLLVELNISRETLEATQVTTADRGQVVLSELLAGLSQKQRLDLLIAVAREQLNPAAPGDAVSGSAKPFVLNTQVTKIPINELQNADPVDFAPNEIVSIENPGPADPLGESALQFYLQLQNSDPDRSTSIDRAATEEVSESESALQSYLKLQDWLKSLPDGHYRIEMSIPLAGNETLTTPFSVIKSADQLIYRGIEIVRTGLDADLAWAPEFLNALSGFSSISFEISNNLYPSELKAAAEYAENKQPFGPLFQSLGTQKSIEFGQRIAGLYTPADAAVLRGADAGDTPAARASWAFGELDERPVQIKSFRDAQLLRAQSISPNEDPVLLIERRPGGELIPRVVRDHGVYDRYGNNVVGFPLAPDSEWYLIADYNEYDTLRFSENLLPGTTETTPGLSDAEQRERDYLFRLAGVQRQQLDIMVESIWAFDSNFKLSDTILNNGDVERVDDTWDVINSKRNSLLSLDNYLPLYEQGINAQDLAAIERNRLLLPPFREQMVSGAAAQAMIGERALLTPTVDDVDFDVEFRALTVKSLDKIKNGEIWSGLQYLGFHAEAYNRYVQGGRGDRLVPGQWELYGQMMSGGGRHFAGVPAEFFGRLKPTSFPVSFMVTEGTYKHAKTADLATLADVYPGNGRYPLILQAYNETFDFGFVDVRSGKVQVAHGADATLQTKVRRGLDQAFSDVINVNLPMEQRVKAAITFRLLADITHAYWRGNVPISTHAGVGLLAMLGVPSGHEDPHFEFRAFKHGSHNGTNLNTFIATETQAAMQRYHQSQNTSMDTPGQQAQQGLGDQDLTALRELQQQQLEQQQLMQQQFGEMQQPSQQAQQGSSSQANSNDAALIKVLRSTQYVEDGQLTDAGREAVQQLQDKLRKAYIKITAADAAYGVLAENSQDEVAELAQSRFQDVVRQAVFKDLDVFSRDDSFGRLDPLRRYREIYQRYKLDQNPLSIMDAIIGHQELVNTGVPKSPDAFMVKLKPYHIEQKMQRALLQFFHEPHLLEGNPDSSIDSTNVRSLTTVNLFPKVVNDLGDGRQVAGHYKLQALVAGLTDLLDSGSVTIINFLNGGLPPEPQIKQGWRGRAIALGIAYTNNDKRDLGQFEQLYSMASSALASGDSVKQSMGQQLMNSARDILKKVMSRNFPGVTAEQLQQQYVAGEAMRRVNSAAQQYRDAAAAFLKPLTDKSVAQVLSSLWQWADTTQMPPPDEVERVYQDIQQQGEYPVSDFEDAATPANKVFAYLRGEIPAKELLTYMVQELLPGEAVSAAQIDALDAGVLGDIQKVVVQRMKGEQHEGVASTSSDAGSAVADRGTTDSLSDQVSNASSDALAEQYQEFAEGNSLFNLTDQQKHPGYTDISLHKKVEHGPGAIGIAPYNLPGLLSEQAGNLTIPVETGIDQSTPTEYTPAQIAPATFNPKSTTPAEPTPEQDRLEQTVRNAYARLPAEVQATLTLEEFRQLDFTEIDLAQQYKAYTSLHRNVTHQDGKPPMRLADYIKFGPEIQQRLQQWSDQAKRSDVEISAYQKQAQIYRGQAAELQQLTQQIQQATAVLTAAQSVKPTQSVERITIPSRYPAAEMIPEQINKASNNIMNTTKAGAPVSGKASTNVPMISLKGKAGLDEYTQSNTIPKYLYRPNQQGQLQLHVLIESGNQLSLQAVPLSVHKPQASVGTHYKPENGWQNIPQLSTTQQSQINQYLQQSTFIMPGPVMAPTAPAGSAPAPVSVPQVAP